MCSSKKPKPVAPPPPAPPPPVFSPGDQEFNSGGFANDSTAAVRRRTSRNSLVIDVGDAAAPANGLIIQ